MRERTRDHWRNQCEYRNCTRTSSLCLRWRFRRGVNSNCTRDYPCTEFSVRRRMISVRETSWSNRLTSLHGILSDTGDQLHSQTSQPSEFFLKPYMQNIRHICNGQRLHAHSWQPERSRSKPYLQFKLHVIWVHPFSSTAGGIRSSTHEHVGQPRNVPVVASR